MFPLGIVTYMDNQGQFYRINPMTRLSVITLIRDRLFNWITFFRNSYSKFLFLFKRASKIRKIRKNEIQRKKMNFKWTLFDQTTSSPFISLYCNCFFLFLEMASEDLEMITIVSGNKLLTFQRTKGFNFFIIT